MRSRLRDAEVRQLVLKYRQYEVHDDLVRGLCIRVSPQGTKAFNLLYRFKGQRRRMTLGRFPDLSVADARELAREIKKKISWGRDPEGEKVADRSRAASYFYPEMTRLYIDEYAKLHTRAWRETERNLSRKEFSEPWRRKPITELRKADIMAALTTVHERCGPSAAAHGLADIKRCISYWVSQELLPSNPCVGIKLPHKPKARDKVLLDTELARLWIAADSMGYPFGPYVQGLMLTLQRRTEVSHIKGKDVDLTTRIWTQVVNKSDRVHRVHLSDDALCILESLRQQDDNRYLFEARGSDNAISGFSKWKQRLDELSGVTGWRLHDIRRSATTRMSELGVQIHVCEMILNHETQQMTRLARTYNRNQFDHEQREAMTRWAAHIRSIVLVERTRQAQLHKTSTSEV